MRDKEFTAILEENLCDKKEKEKEKEKEKLSSLH